MSNRVRHSRGLQLVAKTANAFRVTDWTLNQIDPDGLRYVATMSVRVHWFFCAVLLVQLVYRPHYGVAVYAAYSLLLLLLVGLTGTLTSGSGRTGRLHGAGFWPSACWTCSSFRRPWR